MFHCLFNSSLIYAQIDLLPSALNFGTTGPFTDWIVDVHIQNKSGRKDFILRTTFSHEYEVLFSSKTIDKDSTVVMRVKFIPRLKGDFKEDIRIYFASMSEPIVIPVRAIVDQLNPETNLPCPDFSRMAADCCPENMFIIEVRDKLSGEVIPNATVTITESEQLRLKLNTGPDGRVTQTIPVGYYTIEAVCPDCNTSSISGYINHRHSSFKLELEREQVLVDVADIPVSQSDSTFPEDLYRINHLVFLLDVSSSMATGDKLSLLKGALFQLTEILRPGDQITLLSYADNARILLNTTSGDQKIAIKQIVDGLEASGSTSGAKGFKLSYNILRKEFLPDVNNQLIVITDGVFQPEDQKEIVKLVRKSVKKDITTSIVGIQCASFASMKLSEVSTIGGGSLLTIDERDDLGVLIEELKFRSAK